MRADADRRPTAANNPATAFRSERLHRNGHTIMVFFAAAALIFAIGALGMLLLAHGAR